MTLTLLPVLGYNYRRICLLSGLHRFGLFNPRFNRSSHTKKIEASQRMITMNNQGEMGGMSPPLKRHLELEIKTLETVPRDADKLEGLLKAKRSQKEAMDSEDTKG